MSKQIFRLAIISLVLLMVGCGKKAEYLNVIPADATVVAVFNCESLADQSGLVAKNATEAQAQLKSDVLKRLSVGQADLMGKILDDPTESGIDWTKEAYMFMLPETETEAVVLSVSDKEKLKFTVEIMGHSQFGGKFNEELGCTWAQNRRSCVAFNDKVCILAEAGRGEKIDELKAKMADWMSQDSEKSFVSTNYYEMLADVKGDIRFFSTMNHLPENISMIASMAYSEDMDMNALKYFAGITFHKGQLQGKGTIVVEDEKMLDWLKDQQEVCQKLDGKTLAKLPSNTPLWVGVGLDGDELYDHLLDHPVYGKELKNMRLPFNIEGVLRSIDGDVTLGFPNALFLDVTNKELLKIIVGSAKTMGGLLGISLNEIKEDEYELVAERKSLFRWKNMEFKPRLGMNGDTFYMTSTAAMTEELPKEASLAAAPWAGEVKGNLIFGAFSFENGLSVFDNYLRSKKQNREMKRYFDYATYSQKDIEHNNFTLSFKDKERNSLEQLLEMYVTRF